MIHICFKTSPIFPRICIRRLSSYVDLGTADGDGTEAAAHHIKAVGWDAPKIGKSKCFFNHIFDYIFVGVFCAFVFIYIYILFWCFLIICCRYTTIKNRDLTMKQTTSWFIMIGILAS